MQASCKKPTEKPIITYKEPELIDCIADWDWLEEIDYDILEIMIRHVFANRSAVLELNHHDPYGSIYHEFGSLRNYDFPSGWTITSGLCFFCFRDSGFHL